MLMRFALLNGILALGLFPMVAWAQLNATALLTIPASPISTADPLTIIVPVDDCLPTGSLYSDVKPTVSVTPATGWISGSINVSLTEPDIICQPLLQREVPFALPVSVGQLLPGAYTIHYTTNYRSLSLDIQVAGTAPTIAPLPGLWAITSEIDGSPGRGFQLAAHGNTLVLTYYGYDATGAGRFWLASGPLNGNQFSGTLTTYDGGTRFGGPGQSAHAAGEAGLVSITLSSPIAGMITLPNEAPQPISYFKF